MLQFKKYIRNTSTESSVHNSIEEITQSKCMLHNLDQCPNITGKITKEEGLQFFEQMSLIRRMETTCIKLYQNSNIIGFCHLYVGQEACAVGVKSVMRAQDTAVSSYRCHGWALLISGATEEALTNILKELTGKKTGLYLFLIQFHSYIYIACSSVIFNLLFVQHIRGKWPVYFFMFVAHNLSSKIQTEMNSRYMCQNHIFVHQIVACLVHCWT